MKVAVTGGSGFIGSHVVRELRARGHLAAEIDRTNGLDVRSEAAAEVIAGSDAVIHLAGVLGTDELFRDPEYAVEENVMGTLAVLRACRDGAFTRYVGITMPDVWKNVYQATKRCAKDLASAWHEHLRVPVTHVRAYNVYGPGQKFGEGHPQKIIPTFSVRAWQGRALPIWGDGSQTVDLIHVEDVAQVLVDALAFPGDDETIDAGTGIGVSVNWVAHFVVGVTGRSPSDSDFEYRTMRPGETPQTHVVAAGEGWDRLGWRPQSSAQRLIDVVDSYRPAG
jgi:UDP-glucose 4-epimerase